MKIKIIIFLILLLNIPETFAQLNNSYFISGVITDQGNGKPLEGASVLIKDSDKGTLSDKYGFYSIKTKQTNPIIEYSFLGYETIRVHIFSKENQVKNISLHAIVKDLSEVVIYSEEKIHRITSPAFSVINYKLYYDRTLILGFESGNLKLKLTNVNDSILFTHTLINIKAEKLYFDCFKNTYLITSEDAYQVFLRNDSIFLLTAEKLSRIDSILKPCVESSEEYLYFREFKPGNQSVLFYSINKQNKKRLLIKEITDTITQSMFNDEQQFLFAKYGHTIDSPVGDVTQEQLHTYWKKEFEKQFGVSIVYRSIYIPFNIIKDTINIFDHCNNNITTYSPDGKFFTKVKIDYTQIPGWNNEIISDEITDKTYAVYKKNGIFSLGEINRSAGSIVRQHKIEFPFIENIQVRNNKVYFIYRSMYEANSIHSLYSYSIN